MTPTSSSRANGFTLIELLVVLTILGLVSAALVVTLDPGSDRDEVARREFSADALAEQLAHARASAMSSRTTASVSLPGGNIATYYPDGSCRCPARIDVDPAALALSPSSGLVRRVR